jgi:small subunit ribosomal protein S6
MTKNKLYEGMFLIDSAQAGSDWDGVIATIRTILEKAGATIDSIRKWDDRKLAYEIKGKSRGTYILCYFKVDGAKIQEIETSVRLSEKIVRVLILSTEQQSPEDIEKDTPVTKLEKDKEKRKAAQEAKAEQVSVQEEAGQPEKAKADAGEQPEAGEQPPEETKDAPEETKDAPEDSTEALPVPEVIAKPEVSEVPETSAASDDSVEKQPGQEQVESSEES